MASNQVESGDFVDWTNGSGGALTSGTPVGVGGRIGILMEDIANGATGRVFIGVGVFTVPKATGVGKDFALYEQVILDVSGNTFQPSDFVDATGDISAFAMATKVATTADTTAEVRINTAFGTVA